MTDFLHKWLSSIQNGGSSNTGGHSVVPGSFRINGSSVEVLHSPDQFFSTLRDAVSASQSRVSLAALYIGHGQLEQELLSTIRDKLQEKTVFTKQSAGTSGDDATASASSDFELNVLVDYSRALRRLPPAARTGKQLQKRKDDDDDDAGTAGLDAEVAQQLGGASLLWEYIFGDERRLQGKGDVDDGLLGGSPTSASREGVHTARCSGGGGVAAQIALFQHPILSASPLLQRLPGVLRESMAVQHIKAYVVDDTVRCVAWVVFWKSLFVPVLARTHARTHVRL